MMILYFVLLTPGEPHMLEGIIMALKLSSTVHGTNISCRGGREAPAAAQDSDVSSDHEMYQNISVDTRKCMNFILPMYTYTVR